MANIVDNIQLLEVNIEISLDLEYFEEIWKPDESGYNKTVLVPNSTKLFSYRISAIDTASNQQIYYRTLIVEDNDKPSIIDHSYNSGQIYELRVEATDNVDIETVNVDYWFESTDVETLTLEINDGFYQGSIHIPEGTEKLYYAIFAVDTSKNWERTKEKEVELLEPELEHKPEDKPSSSTTTLEEMAYWILLMIIIIIIIILIVFQWISKRKKRSEPDRKPEPILPKIETVTVKPTTSITKHTKESISISTPEIPANSTSLTVTLTQAQAPTPQQIPQPIPVPQLPPAKGQGQTDIQAQPKPIISITPTGPTTPTMDPISQIGSLKNNNQDVAK